MASSPSHLPSTVAEICSGNSFSENTRVREAAIRVAVLIRFASRLNFGLFRVNLGKELPYIVKQEIGLLESREVSASRHFSFLYYVVRLRDPAKRRAPPPLENPHTPQESAAVAVTPFLLR